MDKDIEQLRKLYLKQKLPDYLEKHGLADLRFKLEERKKPSVMPALGRFSMALTVLLILIFVFLVNATENSHPGNALYQVKKFSSNVAKKLNNGPSISQVSSPSASISSPSATPILKHNAPLKKENNQKVNFSQFLLNYHPNNSHPSDNSLYLPFQAPPVYVNTQKGGKN